MAHDLTNKAASTGIASWERSCYITTMRRALAILVFLAASAAFSADDGLVPWVPKLPPPPSPEADDGLVPWDPGTLARMLASREPTGKEAERAAREAAAYRAKVLEAKARLERRLPVVEVEELFLDPSAFHGRRVAIPAIPSFVHAAAPVPTCRIAAGSAGPDLLGALSLLPVPRRRELLVTGADRAHVIFFIGRLRPLPGSRPYFDVEDFVDVGRVPADTVLETHEILVSSVPVRSHRRDEIEALKRTARIVNGREWPYVPLKRLLADPAARLGRPVSTIGFCDFYGITADGPTPNCRLKENHYSVGAEFFEVLLSKLDRPRRLEILRGRRFAHAFGVTGYVRKSAGGAYYLEAASVEGAGYGSSVELVLNPEYFDSREYRAKLAAANEKAVRALAEAEASWPAPVVDLEDVVLSSKSFLGAPVAVLGFASGVHRVPDGLVGTLSFKLWDRTAVALRLERCPAGKRKAAGSWPELEGRIVLARGTVREKEGVPYIDAEDLVDAGEAPVSAGPIRQILEYTAHKTKPVPASALAAARAAVAEMKAGGDRAYVLFEDLILDPRRWLGRPVSVVGAVLDATVDVPIPYFDFGSSLVVRDRLQVSMERLGLPLRKELLRLEGSYRVIGLAARMKRAGNGAFYLEADGFKDIAPQIGDLVINDYR